MKPREANPWHRPIAGLSGLVVATILLVSLASAVIPPEKVCPDFIQFWTAATLLSSGRDPYDAALQAGVQRGLGWARADEGLALDDFLPYYYPPWLGLACVPLLPLGYPLAKITWLVLNGALLLGGLPLEGDGGRHPPVGPPRGRARLRPLPARDGHGPGLPPLLFLIAVAWKLLDDRRDVAAGCVLALATIKPQLTGMLLLVILCHSARSRRWGVVRGFAATLATLCLACGPRDPGLADRDGEGDPGDAPPDRVFPPGRGHVAHGAEVARRARPAPPGGLSPGRDPTPGRLLRLAIERCRRLDDLICLSLISIGPYGRHYDFPVLLIPHSSSRGTASREWQGPHC